MALGTRKKRAKGVGRRRREGLDPASGAPSTGIDSPTSLPPSGDDPAAGTTSTSLTAREPLTAREQDAKARALMIVAHRAAGLSDTEVAEAMGLKSAHSIKQMLYRAGQRGWLSQDLSLYDPKDRFEYQVGHKVVDRLVEGLDHDNPDTRLKTALKLTDYVLQRKEGQQAQQQLPPAVVAIKIEHVNTGPIREGTVHGTPAFLDGEVSVPQD